MALSLHQERNVPSSPSPCRDRGGGLKGRLWGQWVCQVILWHLEKTGKPASGHLASSWAPCVPLPGLAAPLCRALGTTASEHFITVHVPTWLRDAYRTGALWLCSCLYPQGREHSPAPRTHSQEPAAQATWHPLPRPADGRVGPDLPGSPPQEPCFPSAAPACHPLWSATCERAHL